MGSPYAVAAAWVGLALASAVVAERVESAVSFVEIRPAGPPRGMA